MVTVQNRKRLIFCNVTLTYPEVTSNKEPVVSDPLHLVCPHCGAVNRVPAAKLGQAPNCGQCHEPLFTAHPVELTAASFAAHI